MKIFDQNMSAKVQRSAFDLSHEHKFSAQMGHLVPVLCQEVVPGDKFNIDTQSMIRFAPMIAPVMHRINSYIHYFYVPSRILWDGWEKFITEGIGTVPTVTLNSGIIPEGGLLDHFGIPPGEYDTSNEDISKLPFYAYFKIYNEYYRDQNLSVEIDYENILDANLVEWPLEVRHWEKDYFTSALPWAQKGNPVTMDATVNYRNSAILKGTGLANAQNLVTVDTLGGEANVKAGASSELKIDNIDSINITVEELRRATRLQRWLERNARSGSRYVEHLLAHWGVRSSDARLQRPEYIGGGKSPVVISEVLNTTGTEELPQGNMAGHGINVGRTNQASKYCEEHGYIIGIMSVIPEPGYMQGLPRHFSRKLNLDYYYPEFAQLGEQEVLNKEIFFDNNEEKNNQTFGYQSRYAEYKYAQSSVHGAFRSSLDFWTAVRKFNTRPSLNEGFVKCNPTDIVERIFAVPGAPEHMYVQLYHKITAVRPMPFFNDPKL